MRIQCHRSRFFAIVVAAAATAVCAPVSAAGQTPITAAAKARQPSARQPSARQPSARQPSARQPSARQPSARQPSARDSLSLAFVRPAVGLMWTGGAPDPRGDGAAWTSVGLDLVLTAGARGSLGPLQFRVEPALFVNQNRDHQTFPSGDAARDAFASPFYFGDFSADLPSRPGDDLRFAAALGETGIWWSGRRAFVGLLATTPDWGPGGHAADAAGTSSGVIGEGLVLGRSAAGIPRLEAALAWHPDAGTLRLRWFTGVAQESDWFDADPDNDTRLLSGARLEFGSAHESVGQNLTDQGTVRLGLARTVMSVSGRSVLSAALHPFAGTGSDPVIDIISTDLLYHHDGAGTTAWLELARQEPLEGVRDFLRFPAKGIAFRAGMTQRLVRTADAEWSASMELARLDQSGTTTDESPTDFYTSARVLHGWTHRGQPLGSGLGPGGQRQIARLERAGRSWRLGTFVERVRRNEDALYRQAAIVGEWHDVTLQAGLLAARRFGAYDVAARLSAGKRLNYLFQGAGSAAGSEPVDLGVLRFGLSFTPADGVRRIVAVLPES